MKIEEIAEANDASIHIDKDGDIALLARIYNDGVKQVRFAPSPCNFHPRKEWESLTPKEAARLVC